jgi:hypothetical protein
VLHVSTQADKNVHCLRSLFIAEQVNGGKDALLPTKVVRSLCQRGVESFTVSHTQAEQFVRHMVKAIVTGNVPFTFIENQYLVQACQSVGIQLPKRRQLAEKWVPELASET